MQCAEVAVARGGQNGDGAAALLRTGLTHLQRGEYEAAIAIHSALLDLDPKNVLAYTNRAAARMESGDREGALADLDRALQLNPGFAPALEKRGDWFVCAGELDRAMADYSHVFRSTPFSAPVYLKRGDVHRAKHDYDRAIADYGRALRLDPLDPKALLKRGLAYRLRGLHKLALADLESAARLDSQDDQVYAERAFVLRALGRYDAALADFDAALRLSPENADFFYERGRTRELQRDFEGALKDFDEAIQRTTESAPFLNSRGLLHLRRDNVDLAIFDFTAALRVNDNMSEAYYNRASAWTKKGRFDKTVTDCGRALALQPERIDACFLRASAYAQQGLHELACSDIERALAVDGKNARAYHVRAVIRMREGDYQKALADFGESIRLNPKNALTFARRGMAHQLLEQHEQALADLHQAVLLDPQYTTAYCNQRALVHAAKEEYEQALADYAIALQLDRTNVTALAGHEQALRALQERRSQPTQQPVNKPGDHAPQATQRADSAVKDGREAKPKRAAVTRVMPVGARIQAQTPIEGGGSDAGTHNLANTSGEGESISVAEDASVVLDIQTGDAIEISAEDWEIAPDGATAAPEPAARSSADRLAVLAAENLEQKARPDQGPHSSEAREAENLGPHQARLLRARELEEIEERNRHWVQSRGRERPAEPAQLAKAALSSGAAKSVRASKAGDRHEVDTSEYEQEQALLKEREKTEEQKRLADRRASDYLQKQRIQAKAAALLAKHQKQRTTVADDDRTFLERWQKPLLGVAAALVAATLGYFSWGFYVTHRKFDPPLDAAAVWEEYNSNPDAADRKYAHQRFFVAGKIVIEQRGGKKGPREFYFQPPGNAVLRIHCTFSATNEMGEVPNGPSKTAYLISGEFQPYDKGPLIEMSNCEFIGGTALEAALPPAFPEYHAASPPEILSPDFHVLLTKPAFKEAKKRPFQSLLYQPVEKGDRTSKAHQNPWSSQRC